MDDKVQPQWGEFYKNYTTLELIARLKNMYAVKADLEQELKDTNAEFEFLTKVAIPERFVSEGVKNMVVEGVGRIGLRADIYASIKAGAKAEAYQWLSDVGAGDLIQDSVPPSTLKAFLKSRLKAAEDIPDELFNVTPYQQASITTVK